MLRRLDHVGVAVSDSELALRYFSGRLGLEVVHVEERDLPRVRLTYLDAGNAFLQLVEPLDGDSAVAGFLRDRGEGLHHLCFGVDDVAASVAALAQTGAAPIIGGGRKRESAFVPGPSSHGVTIECTEFSHQDDVERSLGWIPVHRGI